MVKSLAAAGPFLCSGGADDLIHLYDLKHGKDLGFLVNPGVGAITAMSFYTPVGAFRPTHLLAGCHDGSVTVWSVADGWQCMKTLRGHRGEVYSVAVHGTGVLALSTSHDGTLRLWDLVKGRTTFMSKLEEVAEEVRWSPSGKMYGLRGGRTVSVFRVGDGAGEGACVALEHSRRVTSFCFGNGDDAVITGTEDGKIRAWRLDRKGETAEVVVELDEAHASRIKAFAIPCSYTVARENDDDHDHDDDSDSDSDNDLPKPEATALGVHHFPAYIASASSDGHVSVWNLRAAVEAAMEGPAGEATVLDASSVLLSSTNTGARLTTMVSVDSVDMMEVKALELSMKNKQVKQLNKQVKRGASQSKKVVKAGTKRSKPSRPEGSGVGGGRGAKVESHGKDVVVSFLDDKDADKAAKQAKKIAIEAKRRSQQGNKKGQKRR